VKILKTTLVALVIAALGVSGGLRAQDSEGQTPPPQPNMPCMQGEMFLAQGQMGDDTPGYHHGRMNPERMEMQRQHLEQLRMLKMLELLNLSEDQEIPFLRAFNDVQKKHRDLEQQVRQRLDELAKGIQAGDMADSEIYSLVGQINDLDKQKAKVTDDFLAQARGMLTAEQFGKLVIFQKRFEVELLERLGRFREGRRQGMGGGDLQGEG
jgi:hypothetical protein